jgi:hypothetical protein
MDDAREIWPNFAEGRKEVFTLPVYAGKEVKRLA